MPEFRSIQDLPRLIRTSLPEEAQEVYRAAFNRSWEKLSAGEAENQQEITAEAHKAARQAVEYQFSQDDAGNWHRDPIGEEMKRQGKVKDEPKIR
jgi:cation transport regulator ChaB